MSRRAKPFTGPPKRGGQTGPIASVRLLERFTEADLTVWNKRSQQLDELHHELYHGLEPQRIARRAEFTAALQSKMAPPFEFEGWVRMIEYRYSRSPLSAAGSVRGIGGRFNIGNDCDAARTAQVFPALYLGDSHETAFREMYQMASDANHGGLTAQELALRRSDASVRLRGRVERIFDVRDVRNLEPLAKVLARFEAPNNLKRLAKELKLPKPPQMLIRDAATLQTNLQEFNWRMWPTQFELPSPSQRFGRMLKAAGIEGVLYASSKLPGSCCLAIFPSNIENDGTFVELIDQAPEGTVRQLDVNTADSLCGWEHVRPQDMDR